MNRDKFYNQPLQKIMDHKEMILKELKKKGCRITNQRKLIIDIILDNECSCCKEIYYQANQKDSTIGIATVYRMVKTLEEIGAIDRKNLYRISYHSTQKMQDGCIIFLKSQAVIELSPEDWAEVLELGLKTKGCIKNDKIESIVMKHSDSVMNKESE